MPLASLGSGGDQDPPGTIFGWPGFEFSCIFFKQLVD